MCHTVITTCVCVCVCIPFSTSLSHMETAPASSWILNVTKCHKHGWLSNILRYKFVCGRVCCPWVCVWLEKLPTGPEEAKTSMKTVMVDSSLVTREVYSVVKKGALLNYLHDQPVQYADPSQTQPEHSGWIGKIKNKKRNQVLERLPH